MFASSAHYLSFLPPPPIFLTCFYSIGNCDNFFIWPLISSLQTNSLDFQNKSVTCKSHRPCILLLCLFWEEHSVHKKDILLFLTSTWVNVWIAVVSPCLSVLYIVMHQSTLTIIKTLTDIIAEGPFGELPRSTNTQQSFGHFSEILNWS